ncbi:glutamate--cysteine ligase regulatory subunit-like [Mytilus californianus]|uniref:GCS light chain n=1 Tax=Mytilus coruscus TaxID=42192 RepID=A0A6J8B3A2_MYTCO|nr:glutamate--cysteine ligase regulatory subunit-like [Mytilus californianus]CAC5377850.1 GCLM [Mytilus coruscus]
MTEESTVVPLVIPKVGSVVVHTGNIVHWNRLKRKANETPTTEITESVGSTFRSIIDATDKNQLQYQTELTCNNDKFIETLPEEERGDLKLTVKIFLCSLLPAELLKEATNKALKELNVSFIETVLLALPEFEDEDDLTLDIIKPYWTCLEELVDSEAVLSLGIADLNKTLLEQLYNWARVKPHINQVNLESCCVMPKDLVEYAKDNDIQLLTHNDPRDILPTKSFQELISTNTTEKDGEGWEPLWVLRYSVLVKCRGIIKTKGYIMKGYRDTKKRK